jgi:hypothetical protein
MFFSTLLHLLPFLPWQFPPQFYQFGSGRNQNPHKWIYEEPNHPKHTTTMVSRLPLWQHGFGELAHPSPGSCFGRGCSMAELKGLASFYCVAENKINYLTQ